MATSTVPASIEKRRLRNTPMYINRVQSSHEVILNRLIWEISNFRNLENRIYYETDVLPLTWRLSLYKDNQTLFLKVVPERYNKKIMCFLFHTPVTSIPIEEAGRYEYQIPFASIQDPKNKLYEGGWLVLEFQFLKRVKTTPVIRPFISENDSVHKLFKDIFELDQRNGLELDFSLLHNDGSYATRKDVLAARCKFFRNYFKSNLNSIVYQIDTRQKVVEWMGSYIMYGWVDQPTELEDLLDLFMFGVFLKIPNLQCQCEAALKECMNRGNVYQIREAGVRSGTESLVGTADNFIGENYAS